MKLLINNKFLNIKIPLTFKEKLEGLIPYFPINFGMYFKNCTAIHTFGMKEAIDILVLDNQNTILFIFNNLESNKILEVKRNINETNILELPKGLGKYFKVDQTIYFFK